jgi:hypothetical protein
MGNDELRGVRMFSVFSRQMIRKSLSGLVSYAD